MKWNKLNDLKSCITSYSLIVFKLYICKTNIYWFKDGFKPILYNMILWPEIMSYLHVLLKMRYELIFLIFNIFFLFLSAGIKPRNVYYYWRRQNSCWIVNFSRFLGNLSECFDNPLTRENRESTPCWLTAITIRKSHVFSFKFTVQF